MSEISTSPEAWAGSPLPPILSNKLSRPSSKPPSNIAAALQLLKDCNKCTLEDHWNPIQLQPGDYEELLRYLEREEGDLLGYIDVGSGKTMVDVSFFGLSWTWIFGFSWTWIMMLIWYLAQLSLSH